MGSVRAVSTTASEENNQISIADKWQSQWVASYTIDLENHGNTHGVCVFWKLDMKTVFLEVHIQSLIKRNNNNNRLLISRALLAMVPCALVETAAHRVSWVNATRFPCHFKTPVPNAINVCDMIRHLFWKMEHATAKTATQTCSARELGKSNANIPYECWLTDDVIQYTLVPNARKQCSHNAIHLLNTKHRCGTVIASDAMDVV